MLPAVRDLLNWAEEGKHRVFNLDYSNGTYTVSLSGPRSLVADAEHDAATLVVVGAN